MEFPVGHGHHTHHHRRDDEENVDYPPPASTFSSFDNPHQPPPPPPVETQVLHTSHSHVTPPGLVSQDFSHSAYPPPPNRPYHEPDSFNYGYQSEVPPPSVPPASAYHPPGTATSVHHVSHDVAHTNYETHDPHLPSSVHHASHQGGSGLSNKSTVRVVTKAAPDYSLTIRRGKVVLVPSDPRDEYQHWYKDEKYSTRVKDEEGCPAFSLVNKVTGEAIKHSIGATHPVQLIPYNPEILDQSILWTESRDLGDGYRAIRMVNNVHLNVDAYHGDKNSGGVHDGTTIVLWDWNSGDNQHWKILPYCKSILDGNVESLKVHYL